MTKNSMKISPIRGIYLSTTILFSIFLVLIPIDVYANEVDVKTVGLEETSIITITNNSEENIKMFRIWLGGDLNFESFKTEKGWIGEKTPQGVIIFTSPEPINKSESVKFGIKTNKINPIINWKALDGEKILGKGVVESSKLNNVIQNSQLEINKNLDKSGDIFSKSTFKIIPNKPNSGSTIRVVGENFGNSQIFDFYIDGNKIGEFYTDENGKFVTTMKIPNASKDRVDFKIKNDKNEEKIVSLRLGENENRIMNTENIKLSINGIPNILKKGELLELQGEGIPNTSITIKIQNPEKLTIISKTAEVNNTGKWKISEKIDVGYDAILGKYNIVIGDGRNQVLKYFDVETNKILLIDSTKTVYEPGELIKFNGTVIPNESLELILQDNLSEQIKTDIIDIKKTGKFEFEYQTTENEDKEGTWTLIATQGKHKEFIFVGYGVTPTIPTQLEFDKTNYKTTEKATIYFTGEPLSKLKMIIISPSGNIGQDETVIILKSDGKSTYELNLQGYTSGIYTAVIQKDNAQTIKKFSVGLQLGSGPINAQVTQAEYQLGEKILLIGNANPNSLITATLVDSNNKKIKSLEFGSNNQGQFSEEFTIPSNGETGIWKINLASGTNFETVEFEVFQNAKTGLILTITEDKEIAGFGKNIKFNISSNHKTSIAVTIASQNGVIIDDSITCNTTSDFKCEIIWTITKDLLPGIYTVTAKDGAISTQSTFNVK